MLEATSVEVSLSIDSEHPRTEGGWILSRILTQAIAKLVSNLVSPAQPRLVANAIITRHWTFVLDLWSSR